MEPIGFDESNLTAQLVEKQLGLWSARRRASREGFSSGQGFRFVTLAADEGCLANEIAQELSSLLGWHVFDKEIVTYIAKNSHISDKLVKELDQKSQNFIQDEIERLLKMPEFASFGSDEYHEGLLGTLMCLATHGAAILMGRGANFALRENAHGLHVRFFSSPEVRIRRLSKSWRITEVDARHRMEADDKEIRKFIRHYYYHDFDDLRFYDIVFNTDRCAFPSVASCIQAYMKHAEASPAGMDKAVVS
jgi:cytidylate kinase